MPQRDQETQLLQARGRLWDLNDRISRHRREGKNRRDGATISTRVLALVSALNQDLFDQLIKETAAADPTDVRKSRGRRSKL